MRQNCLKAVGNEFLYPALQFHLIACAPCMGTGPSYVQARVRGEALRMQSTKAMQRQGRGRLLAWQAKGEPGAQQQATPRASGAPYHSELLW